MKRTLLSLMLVAVSWLSWISVCSGDDIYGLQLSATRSSDAVAVGGTLTYTITLVNRGDGDWGVGGRNSIQIIVSIPRDVAQPVASSSWDCRPDDDPSISCSHHISRFSPGQSITVTFTARAIATGFLTPLIRAAGWGRWYGTWPMESMSNEVRPGAIVYPAPPNLAVSYTGDPNPVSVGNNLVYTTTVANLGPGDATGVGLSITIPPRVRYLTVSFDAGHCEPASLPRSGVPGLMDCRLGDLANRARTTVRVTVRPESAETLTSVARVTAVTPNPVSADPDPSNNSATATTTVLPAANLRIEKTASVSTALLNSEVTYRITVTNNGPSTATNVTMTDALPVPAGLSATSAPPTVTFASASSSQGSCATSVVRSSLTLTCPIGTLARGASATVTIVLRVTADATLRNSAGVTATEPDPDLSNNTAAVTTTVTRPPLPGARPVPTPTPPRLPPAPPFPPRPYPSPK